MSANSLEFTPVRLLAPAPDVAPIPLVLDSPHSGIKYPKDFAFSCDFATLRKAEDTDVDDLFADAPLLGATFVCADFPRSYIDPNRRVEDIDAEMIAGRWPGKIDLSPKTQSGIGLIWKKLNEQTPIYARRLSVDEVQSRIANCHAPYWNSLRSAIESAYGSHGKVFHINCHSMPADTTGSTWLKAGTVLPDVVLGDRDGSTCSPDYTMMLHDAFRAEGLSVAINDPYKGVEIVKQLGKPRERRHSIQIEINRRLYMHEPTRERNANYDALKQSLRRVLRTTRDFIAAH